MFDLYFSAQEFHHHRWPPVIPVSGIHTLVNMLMAGMFTAGLVVTTLMVAAMLRTKAWRDLRIWLALCLMAAAYGQMALQGIKQFYNVSLIWGSMLLAGLVAFSLLKQQGWRTRTGAITFMFGNVWLIAGISQGVLLASYVPYARQLNEDGADQLMIVPAQYAEQKQVAEALASECGILLEAEGQHIVVDTYTYWFAKRSYQPLRLTFRFHEFDTAEALEAFMRKWDSAGLLLSCDLMPENLRSITKREGMLCCLPRAPILSHP